MEVIPTRALVALEKSNLNLVSMMGKSVQSLIAYIQMPAGSEVNISGRGVTGRNEAYSPLLTPLSVGQGDRPVRGCNWAGMSE